jgi:hypothetical protein
VWDLHSDELKRIAKEELGETEEIARNAVREMREWIMNNPRIVTCRLDSYYLMPVLRWKKFNLLETQEVYERQLLFNCQSQHFANLDPFQKNVMELLDLGVILTLPMRDKNNRLVIMINYGRIDTSMENVGNAFLTLFAIILVNLTALPENQIRGIHYIANFKGVHFKHVTIFPVETWYKQGKGAEVS